MDQLGVRSKATEMSFSVHDTDSNLEYNGNTLNSLFAQRSNLLSPGFWGMLRDILRFNRQAIRDLDEQRIASDTRLGDYLQQQGYGTRFIEHYIVPMGAAIWSMSLADMLSFPLQFFVRFFKNHGLLSVSNRPQWRVIEGGSSAYIQPLSAGFADRIRLNCPVIQVTRNEQGVQVHSAGGIEDFDKVIFACHSDQALKLLATPSSAERQILAAMPYADNDVVLHTDTRLLPDRKLAWASWNYRLSAQEQASACVTYNMNILQGLPAGSPLFCVTLNPDAAVDERFVLQRFVYEHPLFNPQSWRAQARRGEINGHQRSWFCGAYWYNGFHEDGVRSALDVVNAIAAGEGN